VSERLDDLFNDLGEAADGKRHLPVLQPGDASLVVGLFHSQIDLAVEAREQLVEAGGRTVACQKGCNHCCTNVVIVFAGEAVAIAEWLQQPEQAEILAGFQARYPEWRRRLERDIEAWDAVVATGNEGAAKRVIAGAWKEQVMCAFNVDGACSIYDVRPAICRNAHALDTNEHCKPGATGEVVSYRFEPLEEYVAKIQPIVLAMHAALRPNDGARPLCLYVHEALTPPR
jgi:hypothetical protein